MALRARVSRFSDIHTGGELRLAVPVIVSAIRVNLLFMLCLGCGLCRCRRRSLASAGLLLVRFQLVVCIVVDVIGGQIQLPS